jgi:hypothetical protein
MEHVVAFEIAAAMMDTYGGDTMVELTRRLG